MAKRDVQLVIKARSEADRAINSISSALKSLAGVQSEVSGSGERAGNTLERLTQIFASVDAAFAKIDKSVEQASAAFNSQQSTLAENEARYASLTAQIKAAEQAIVNAGIALNQDGTNEAASRLGAVQAAYKELTSEAGRLKRVIAGQRADVSQAGDAYEELERAATAAQMSMREAGSEGERESLRVAAAARQAEDALRDQAAAAEQAAQIASMQNAALRARGRRDGNGGAIPAARDTALAETLKLEQATADAEAAERGLESAAKMSEAALKARARAAKGGESGLKASETALAQAMREEEEAAQSAARANADLDAAHARLRARLDPTSAAQDRVNREIDEAKRLYQAGRLSLLEYAQAADKLQKDLDQTRGAQNRLNRDLNRNGSKELKGLFGLRPYELQNLSYQINDLFTQIASGTPASQAFAQQGGQIVQLFPKMLTGVLKYGRALGLLGLVLTPIIISFNRFKDAADAQREFTAQMALSADGATKSAKAMYESAKAINTYGVALTDAKDAVLTFEKASISPEFFDEFGQAAKDLADVTGKDLPESAEEVAKAFSGGYKELAAFDDELNFLTLSEREQIRSLYDMGNEAEATALAFDIFSNKVRKSADESQTWWGEFTNYMAETWAIVTEALGDSTVWNWLSDKMYGLYQDAKLLHGMYLNLLGIDAPGAGVASVGASVGNSRSTGDPVDRDSERRLKDESDERYNARRRNRGGGGGGRGGKSLAELQADFNREIARSNRNREIEAEYAARTNTISGETLIVEQRRQAIAEALRDAEERAARDSDKQLTLSQAQRDEIARTVGLEFDARNARAVEQARQLRAEQEVNDLIARRAALVQRSQYQAAGSDQANETLRQIDVVEARLEEATGKAIDYWTAVALDPERMDLLETNADQVAAIIKGLQNQLTATRADGLKNARQMAEQEVATLLEMQALLLEQIEAAQVSGNTGQVGLLTEQLAGVETRLAQAAENAILFWEALRGNPEDLALLGITPEMVDAIILKLRNVQAQGEKLRTQFLKTGSQINRDLAVGAANAFERFAESVANGENALSSLANAFLSFASDFLRQIAQMILQQAIFNALSGGTAGGAGGVGGGIAGIIGGLFHGGGVVAGGGRSRAVASAMFANATRYHGGGIAGLAPNEVPAILERGEEVLTRADPRHSRNGGGAPAQGDVKIVNVGDPAAALEAALADRAGQKVILNFLYERGFGRG